MLLCWIWYTGVPDLVPDLSRLRSSLLSRRYVDRIPLYYLSCALDEGCLSSSAVGAPRDNTRHVLFYTVPTQYVIQ